MQFQFMYKRWRNKTALMNWLWWVGWKEAHIEAYEQVGTNMYNPLFQFSPEWNLTWFAFFIWIVSAFILALVLHEHFVWAWMYVAGKAIKIFLYSIAITRFVQKFEYIKPSNILCSSRSRSWMPIFWHKLEHPTNQSKFYFYFSMSR